MAVLVYYRVQRGPHLHEVFQAVLIAHESTVKENRKQAVETSGSFRGLSLLGYP